MSAPSAPVRLSIEPLTPNAFSAFGNVIANPSGSPSDWPSTPASSSANQGTATKYSDVSHLTNHYGLSPSHKPALPLISMFVCSPRPLVSALDPGSTTLPYPGTTKTLRVPVLERHPYTTQTFIPLGLSPSDRDSTYIVVVAPTLSTVSKKHASDRPPPYPSQRKPRSQGMLRSIFSRARPEPFTNDWSPATAAAAGKNHPSARPAVYDAPTKNSLSDFRPAVPIRPSFSSLMEYRSRPTPLTESLFRPKGPGRPDLSRAKAFVCHGGQAVTYAPGTWHAPMIVVGPKDVEFVVLQWGNGIAAEDCQETELERDEAVLEVVVEEGAFGLRTGAGVGIRAKL